MPVNNRASEKWLERAVSDYVSSRGGASIKLLASVQNGLPDRLILWQGGFAEFVELKSTGETKSFIQRTVCTLLVEMGFRYTVIDSEKALQQWQNLHQEHTKPK